MTQNILDEYGNGQKYTYDVKITVMGKQSLEVAQRLVDIYKLPLAPEEYAALTRNEVHTNLMREAKLLPGNYSLGIILISDFSFLFSFINARFAAN